MSDESKAHELIQRIASHAIDGVWKLSGAVTLAEEYSRNPKYRSTEERIDALIRWEAGKNFSTGFATGLGGVLTLPISVPAAIGASWVIQARLAAAIAHLNGYDVHDDQVRSMVVWTLLGDGVKEVIKEVGIQIGKKTAEQTLKRIPGKVLIEINKKVGYRLMTKLGEKGIVNLAKVVPVAGGLVGGVIDAAATVAFGRVAKGLFPPIVSAEPAEVEADAEG